MKYNQSYVKVVTEIEENEWGITEEMLFDVVIRQNKKRSFLFASKVLGKYLPVHPYTPQLAGMLLAEVFNEPIRDIARIKVLVKGLQQQLDAEAFEALKSNKLTLDKRTLFIGFAETATALGHSVFASFKGNATYVHTTRVPIIEEEPLFCFKEEHSHAVDHTCFARNIKNLEEFEQIVLIDDEITTGKTALNLIRAINKLSSVKTFVVVSLLDWRSSEDKMCYEQLEEELGISIQSIALIRGVLEVNKLQSLDDIVLNNEKVIWHPEEKTEEMVNWQTIYSSLEDKIHLKTEGQDGIGKVSAFLRQATGRFGMTTEGHQVIEQRAEEIGQLLKSYRKHKTCLCLGTEEFIYWPCKIAAAMGENVSFACSARSPIVTLNQAGYVIKDAISFDNPEEPTLISYIYNLENKGYEEVFWFLERDVCEAFKKNITSAFYKRGIQTVHFVIL